MIITNQKEHDIRIYNEAKKFLLHNVPSSVTPEIVERYLNYIDNSARNYGIKELYRQLLSTAQNANMRSQVIGGALGDFGRLGMVLFDFDPKATFDYYSGKEDVLLNNIIEKLNPKGKMRTEKRSIWPKYCSTIISAAAFLNQFENVKEFYNWVDYFHNNNKIVSALPMILSEEIEGIGFPLACDFLKEIGFTKFGKPDIHIKDIFENTGLSNKNSSDYNTLKAIVRVAENVGVTPYNVDKLFWLIGSGFFYENPEIGKDGRIPSMKQPFIEYTTKLET